MGKIIVSFKKSDNEDIPVLTVATEDYSIFGVNSMNIVNVITGERAVTLYEELTNRKRG